MTSERPGVQAEPPGPPHGGRRGLLVTLEAFSLRLPFRVKLAVVWLGIFATLALLFYQAKFDSRWMLDKLSFVATGLWVTIFIAVVSIFFAIVLALSGALGRLSKNPVAYGVSGFYTSFFRGTPLIVQMFLVYLGLPKVGEAFREPFSDWFLLDSIVAGIVVLSLNYGAYMTEIFRAGIESVSHGQYEAADALGMNYKQKMRRVVLPQAFRVIIPPTGNEFIAMMKDTALVSLLGTPLTWADPFRRATLVGRPPLKNLEALVVAAALYWVLTGIFTFFQKKLEARVGKGYVREAAATRKGKPAVPPAVPGAGRAIVEMRAGDEEGEPP